MDSGDRDLTSWKEIADYLGVNVRTAQKWESERGLPIRRLPGAGRGRVLVTVTKLENWKQSGGIKDVPDATAKRTVLVRLLPWLAVSLAVIAGGMFWIFGGAHRVPASCRLEGNSLVALDANSVQVWRKTFPPLDSLHYKDKPTYLIADVDGDGANEILFAMVPVEAHTQDSALICFSATGQVKWRFEPGRTVSTRKETFARPYVVSSFGVLSGPDGKAMIAVSANHHLYYPNQLALLSSAGKLVGEYWHSGNLTEVVAMKLPDGTPRLYLGGISNSYKTATVIALGVNDVRGASDESENPDYQLLGFPAAQEHARVLLPRTCVNRRFEKYNWVSKMWPEKDDLMVAVQESRGELGTAVYHQMSWDLEERDFTFNDAFSALHASLRASGALDHDFSDDERVAMRQVRILHSDRK